LEIKVCVSEGGGIVVDVIFEGVIHLKSKIQESMIKVLPVQVEGHPEAPYTAPAQSPPVNKKYITSVKESRTRRMRDEQNVTIRCVAD
jgi:hypothetical protein